MTDILINRDEEDEETMEWEKEQLRRGGKRETDAPSRSVKQEYRPAASACALSPSRHLELTLSYSPSTYDSADSGQCHCPPNSVTDGPYIVSHINYGVDVDIGG